MVNTKEVKSNKKVATKVDEAVVVERVVIKKTFNGEVVSDKMNKTVVVKVDSVKIHPRYKKRYTVSKKYKVHDEKEQYKTGDKVKFIECRPMSKDKRWRVIY
ncbi:30S ribosomal protein S17 [Patescibacteria group bacterium]|nr:30S ribosomal protein S17 [Patescibacteria group bacterium]MBU4309505.1 30S ribosomal protein S17 [Patescibacteria group bacterium]MBU4432063.1 30S ribosomal protein S17 [Patescibacteria group bacterium]MBU4577211.1 30S ribosomal protein S17 [Patescibacteria group bacterium]